MPRPRNLDVSNGLNRNESGAKGGRVRIVQNSIEGVFKKPKGYTNVVSVLSQFENGRLSAGRIKVLGEQFVTDRLRCYQVSRIDNVVFERRITALSWHPTKENIVFVGSKSGELLVRNIEKADEPLAFFEGIGPGGSILSINHDPFTDNCCYTASIDGTVKKNNYEMKCQDALLETGSFDIWYCSVCASEENGLVVAGDTKGRLTVLNKDLKVVSRYNLHKKKLNSAEFCRNNGWLLATASLDCTTRLWDIRKINVKEPLKTLDHAYPVNSAYFSRTDCCRLLTTDQSNELRVYRGPLWDIESVIQHPHRQFQHLTPIKASWHPTVDLIIAGRYPAPSFPGFTPGEPRTVDVFSASSGKMMTQMYSPACKSIMSLNVFNCSGSTLASGMGLYLLFWKIKDLKSKDNFLDSDSKSNEGDNDNDEDDDQPPKKMPPKPRGKKTDSAKSCPKAGSSKEKCDKKKMSIKLENLKERVGSSKSSKADPSKENVEPKKSSKEGDRNSKDGPPKKKKK